MIIGLLGRSRVGKDTAASVIVSVLGNEECTITRLSQPLKDAVRILYGFTKEQVEDEQKEMVDPRLGVTPRVCIQQLCDHIMERHGVDFFSRQLFRRYDKREYGYTHIIIPDIRYEHDIHEIRRRGGIVIKIDRPIAGVPMHPWESHIDGLKGDCTIVNDSDISTFKDKVNQILCNNGLA